VRNWGVRAKQSVLLLLFSWSLPILLFCVYANARLDFTLAAAGGSSAKSFQNPQSAERFLSASVCQREFLNSSVSVSALMTQRLNLIGSSARAKSSRGVRDARVFKDLRGCFL
jgi:hypothetical protein